MPDNARPYTNVSGNDSRPDLWESARDLMLRLTGFRKVYYPTVARMARHRPYMQLIKQAVKLPGDVSGDPIELGSFLNEPATDFSLPHNLRWAEALIERWQQRHGVRAAEIPLLIAGEHIAGERLVCECLDPSRPGVVVGRYRQANTADIERAAVCESLRYQLKP